jgi:Fe-S oxidoreductase
MNIEISSVLERISKIPDGEKYKQCLQCGACGGSCPYGMVTKFTPRKIVSMLRVNMLEELIESGAQWLCTSCYACSLRCPSMIPLTDAVIPAIREASLLNGEVPEELSKALSNTARYGNPFGESQRKRTNWAKELDFEVKILPPNTSTDVLFIPECFGAYHQRCKEVTKAMAKVFHALGVDFAILRDEKCIGDLFRLLGEFGLFEALAEHNISRMSRLEFDRIVTIDAHAFNALRNEYPKFGFEKQIFHHTQFLAENLENLREMFSELDYRVTYHDPCYLGRRNKEYDAPRKVICSIPGIKFVEMERTREDSLCCGAGGGGIWLDSFIRRHLKERLAEERVREAAEVAEVLVTSCILDIPMLDDAVKVAGLEGKLVVRDIAEIVLEALV